LIDYLKALLLPERKIPTPANLSISHASPTFCPDDLCRRSAREARELSACLWARLDQSWFLLFSIE